MQKFVEHAGYDAIVVDSAFRALQRLLIAKFDAVLIDLKMPIMNGLLLTKFIRSGACGEQNKNVFIAAVTACALKGDREMCFDAGMDEYLSKPVMLEELLDMLARVPAREIAA
jgi:CheY-like chemotaxis protein